MTKHPLTDEILEQLGVPTDYGYAGTGMIFSDDDMRAIYDLAINRCVDWLEDHDCDDPQKTAKTLKEAIYSTQEDNS